jgi:hypothetical protein
MKSQGYIIAGHPKEIISKYSFQWSWPDLKSGIYFTLAFNINSDISVPSFKSKALRVEFDFSLGQPWGSSSFNGIIGEKQIYIEIPKWIIEISGSIEGGPDAGTKFIGSGSWSTS